MKNANGVLVNREMHEKRMNYLLSTNGNVTDVSISLCWMSCQNICGKHPWQSVLAIMAPAKILIMATFVGL